MKLKSWSMDVKWGSLNFAMSIWRTNKLIPDSSQINTLAYVLFNRHCELYKTNYFTCVKWIVNVTGKTRRYGAKCTNTSSPSHHTRLRANRTNDIIAMEQESDPFGDDKFGVKMFSRVKIMWRVSWSLHRMQGDAMYRKSRIGCW